MLRTLPVLLIAAALFPEIAAASVPTLSIRAPKAIDDDRKITADLRTTGFRGRIGIERRGSSSARFPKRSYAIETRTRTGDNRNVRLLGLPKENDWILEPAYADPTLMRNVVGYATARRLGRWAPRTRFVELRLNGRYRGVYVLTERPKLDPARVAVSKKGIEGGYLLELTDRGRGHFRGAVSALPYLHKDPERSDLVARERTYISGVVGEAERALQAGTWRDHLDEATAVDFLLLQELFKNNDAFVRSTFLVKGAGAKLAFGPLWDLDRSMGDAHLGAARAASDGFVSPGRPWAVGLLADAGFRAAVVARWRQLRAGGLLEDLLVDVDSAQRTLAGSADRDARRWPGNGRPAHADAVAGLRSWLTARAQWLDGNVERLGV